MIVAVNTFLLVYAALFPIVNPIGSAPLFLGMTESYSGTERIALARRVSINSFLLLCGSLFVGSHVLEFFGITLPVLRIGGGLVVTTFGWKLLNSDTSPDHNAASNVPMISADAFYPLTMPLTVGPGSISVAVALGSQRPKLLGIENLLIMGLSATLGLLAISLTIYLCYRFAQRLVAFLGAGGTNVVVRLSAFILVCIGIQIIWSGWTALSGTNNL